MFGLLNSVVKLTTDVVGVATAPLEVAVDMTRAVVKPLKEVADDIVEEIKEITED